MVTATNLNKQRRLLWKRILFPGFSRSDTYDNNSSGHNKQVGRIYRFEKDKLEAYDEWPAEYYISPKAILYIEGAEEQVQINSTYPAADTTFTVHYYDGTSEEVALSEAYYSSVDTSTLGEKEITLDFGLYRDVYTIQVIAGEIPVVSGIEDDKALAYAEKLPNAYKSRENELVLILADKARKNAVAKAALEPLMWSLALHLKTLSETENNPAYSEKITQIRSILFDSKDNR